MTSTLPTELDELVVAGRRLVALGLSPGSSGNLSVRLGDRVFMSPTGIGLADLEVDSLSILDLDGGWIGGERPSKESPLHRAFYRRSDPEVSSVIHLHSSHAVAASCLASWGATSAIPPLTPYFVMRVGQTPLIPYAPPGDQEQADDIEALELPFRAVLLQNHGLVVGGTSLAAAVDAAIELEEACRLLLLLGGRPCEPLGGAEARSLAERYGSIWTDQGD